MDVRAYSNQVFPHLHKILEVNHEVMEKLAAQIVQNVKENQFLFVFGSGHSSILPLEVYHRAGGPYFVIPLIADFLLPVAGPPVVRMFERTEGSANFLLNRFEPKAGEMIWIASQSGINPAGVELALEAKRRKLHTVAFTSIIHSQGVASRHSSGKRLFEVCDDVVDWGGVIGDASISIDTPGGEKIATGPLSSLSGIFLAHSILTAAVSKLEQQSIRCTYTSVNTPTGDQQNKVLEELAKKRDFLLR